MGREVRRVTKNWEHPKRDNGNYHPMFNEYYGDVLSEWIENNKLWENGTHPDIIDNPKRKEEYPFYSMWDGGCPDVEYYKTTKDKEEDLTHIQMYEDTSEGTPISPVFDNAEDLAHWLADNGASAWGSRMATYEQWLSTINRDFAPSMIMDNNGLRSGVEALS